MDPCEVVPHSLELTLHAPDNRTVRIQHKDQNGQVGPLVLDFAAQRPVRFRGLRGGRRAHEETAAEAAADVALLGGALTHDGSGRVCLLARLSSQTRGFVLKVEDVVRMDLVEKLDRPVDWLRAFNAETTPDFLVRVQVRMLWPAKQAGFRLTRFVITHQDGSMDTLEGAEAVASILRRYGTGASGEMTRLTVKCGAYWKGRVDDITTVSSALSWVAQEVHLRMSPRSRSRSR
jgi:hypothetical protein